MSLDCDSGTNILRIYLTHFTLFTHLPPEFSHVAPYTGKARENCNREGLYHHRVRECSGKMQTEIFSNRNEMIQLGREKKNDK